MIVFGKILSNNPKPYWKKAKLGIHLKRLHFMIYHNCREFKATNTQKSYDAQLS